MKLLFFKLWPILIIVFLVAIFFYPVWLQNKIPLPADFVVGTYYPWLDYKWAGFEAGVPVKNPITTDVVSFMFPMQMFAIDQIKEGIVPLWNNLILTGTPLLANFQSAPFSPTNFLYFIFDKLTAWSLQIIFQHLLAALFLFLLLKEFNRSNLAAITGSIFFSFAGFMTIWSQWNGHSLTAAFFPLIILLTYKLLKSNNLIYGILLSLSLCLQIFSGYPQIILYEFVTLLLFILTFDFKLLINFRKIITLGFFIILGISLAALQILPGAELLANSQRSVETVLNEWAFLPWQLIITLFAPDYFGNQATYNYWGPADYTLTTGFIGMTAGILASLGFILNIKNKFARFSFVLILFSLFIALPNPISIWFKESGFLGLQAASAHRILILENLGFAILVAFGLDGIISKKFTIKDVIRSIYFPLIILLPFTIFTLFILGQNQLGQNLLDIKMKTNLIVGLRNLIFPWIIFFVTTTILIVILKTNKFNKILIYLLVILGIFELFRFGWKFTPFSPRDFVYPQTPIIDFVQKQQKPFRISAENVIPINFMMSYKIETLEGYDAVYPIKFAKYLAVLNSNDTAATAMGRYGSVSNLDSPLLDLTNTKYVLVLKRDKNGKPDSSGDLPEKFNKPFLKKVFEDKTVAVLENTRALPRAVMFYDWVSVSSGDVLEELVKIKDSTKKLILSSKVNINKDKGNANVVITNYTSNQKNIEVNTTKPGILFISDIYYPGWKAYIDGKLTSIINADYTFMAIPISTSGDHRILIKYEPESFEQGKIISLMSLGVLLGIIIFAFWQTKRK